MNNLKMLKKAMLAYVSAVKFIWSGIAYPLSIMGKKFMNLRGYRVYGNSVQDGTPTPDNPVEIESVGDLSTKNLFDYEYFFDNSVIENLTRQVYKMKPNTNYTVFTNVPLGGEWASVFLSSGEVKTVTTINDGVSEEKPRTVMSDENGKITITLRTATITEAIAVNKDDFTNGKYWIMLLEGTYTAETIPEYEPYHKYKIPVVARGKNLLPTPTFSTFTQNGVKFTNNKDGSITINGTPTAYTATPNMYLPNSTLEVLRNNVCVLTGFHYYEKNIALVLAIGLNGNWIKYIYLNSYTYKNYVKVDLTNVEFDTVVFAVRSQNVGVLIDNLTVKPLLEVGTTMPTSFEPYRAPVTTNIFLDEPLRKVGDYADYIDFEKQKVVRKITHKEFSSSDGWSVYTTYPKHFQVYVGNNNYFGSSIKALSNYYPQYKTSQFAAPENNYAVLSVDGERIRFKDVRYTTVDEWKAFLDTLSTPLTVHYILKTPTEETVKLPALPQFKGTTIYEVGTNIKPRGMEAKYC